MEKQKKHTVEYRIKRVLLFYYNRGVNSERCNKIYKKIIKQKFK